MKLNVCTTFVFTTGLIFGLYFNYNVKNLYIPNNVEIISFVLLKNKPIYFFFTSKNKSDRFLTPTQY